MRIGHWIPVIMLCASLGWVRGAQGETQRSERIWQTDPIVLKDVDFDKLVNGSSMWMIDLYSPWCPACQELDPVWKRLAIKAGSGGHNGGEPAYLVGKVNVAEEKVLLHRFQVTRLPTIVHIRGGEVREYEGARSVNSLHQFATQEWRKKEALTGCSSPVSFCGRVAGALVTSPKYVKHMFIETRKEFKHGDLVLVGVILGVPVFAGLLCICLLDFYVTRGKRHHHHE